MLRRAWYSLNQTFRQRIAPLGITPDQFTVLRWLVEGDPRGLTQQQLTDLMASDANTVAALLKRMETEDLVVRRLHESDRRARRVCATVTGKERFTAAAAIAGKLQETALRSLPARKRAGFLADLETVANACRQLNDAG